MQTWPRIGRRRLRSKSLKRWRSSTWEDATRMAKGPKPRQQTRPPLPALRNDVAGLAGQLQLSRRRLRSKQLSEPLAPYALALHRTRNRRESERISLGEKRRERREQPRSESIERQESASLSSR